MPLCRLLSMGDGLGRAPEGKQGCTARPKQLPRKENRRGGGRGGARGEPDTSGPPGPAQSAELFEIGPRPWTQGRTTSVNESTTTRVGQCLQSLRPQYMPPCWLSQSHTFPFIFDCTLSRSPGAPPNTHQSFPPETHQLGHAPAGVSSAPVEGDVVHQSRCQRRTTT